MMTTVLVPISIESVMRELIQADYVEIPARDKSVYFDWLTSWSTRGGVASVQGLFPTRVW